MAVALAGGRGGYALFVLADLDAGIGEEAIRRHEQVRGGGNALEHPSGEVELGLVARTEEAAEPVGAEVRRGDLGAIRRRAAEMGADADRDEDLRLDRPVLVLGVLGLV